MPRTIFGNLRLAWQTAVVVAILVALRAVLWELGVEGMSPTAVSAGIITAGIFVVGLLVAGTLSDHKEAERVPTDLAAGLQTILRECQKRPARAVAEQRDRDDHVGEVMPLDDREEAGQQYLVSQQPGRDQRDRDERHAQPTGSR